VTIDRATFIADILVSHVVEVATTQRVEPYDLLAAIWHEATAALVGMGWTADDLTTAAATHAGLARRH
jgi:hypothetical protein